MRQPAAGLEPEAVHVYHADASQLGDASARIQSWLGWLSPSERDRYDRFRHDADRAMFLAGRAMARELVGATLGLPPGAWPWREGPHGRPEIALDTPLRFNVAHSGDVVVCALAHGREVGVDVEHLDRRALDPGLVPRYCSPAEAADVHAQPRDTWQRRFLRYWTLKEAYLKARGLGIAVPLAEIEFTLDDDGRAASVRFLGSLAGTDARWRFDLFEPTPRHFAAVATTVGRAPVVRPFV